MGELVKVAWPSTNATNANVWRVLDLVGLTRTVRDSVNFTRSGFVRLNGNRVTMKTMVPLDCEFTLSLEFPNGIKHEKRLMLINTVTHRKQRRPGFGLGG